MDEEVLFFFFENDDYDDGGDYRRRRRFVWNRKQKQNTNSVDNSQVWNTILF